MSSYYLVKEFRHIYICLRTRRVVDVVVLYLVDVVVLYLVDVVVLYLYLVDVVVLYLVDVVEENFFVIRHIFRGVEPGSQFGSFDLGSSVNQGEALLKICM